MTFDEQQLESVLPVLYVDRGRRYVEDGRVLSVDQRPDNGLVYGRVRGSRGRAYQVVVQVDDSDGPEPQIRGHCSCPVGWNCKHVAAVLLAAGRDVDEWPEVPESDGLPPRQSREKMSLAVSNWLRESEQLEASDDDPHWLLYLLRIQSLSASHARVHVSAVKARRLQNGA
jgi:uncharacterized Zn finger protein